VSPAKPHAADAGESRSKKALILEVARELAKPRYTPAEIEQIRRKLIANLGAHGKTSVEYIVSVLARRFRIFPSAHFFMPHSLINVARSFAFPFFLPCSSELSKLKNRPFL